jgi:acyl CoA:acetate/3-ketoacid CoA transferase beta subunit
MNAEQVILRRLTRELRRSDTVALGPGVPEKARNLLAADQQVYRLGMEGLPLSVDLIAVEADEVSSDGAFCISGETQVPDVEARGWIIATYHTRENGKPRIVQTCRSPQFGKVNASKIITQLGVIEVTESGLVLREVAPGVSTDDVKKATAASLHIADDIKLMEL